jgi:hypothetical protein
MEGDLHSGYPLDVKKLATGRLSRDLCYRCPSPRNPVLNLVFSNEEFSLSALTTYGRRLKIAARAPINQALDAVASPSIAKWVRCRTGRITPDDVM